MESNGVVAKKQSEIFCDLERRADCGPEAPHRPEGVLSQGPNQGALVQLVQDQFKRYRQINITFYKLVKGKFLVPVI